MKKRLFILTTVMMLSMTALTACGNKDAAKDVSEIETLADVNETTEDVTLPVETEATEATESIPETESIEATEMPDTTEVAEASDITEMAAVKYAKSSVNVRDGAGTEYNRLGGLSTNQKVTVTGQAKNGWYRIDFDGKDGFVSDKYLVDEKVSVAQTPQAQPENTTPAASTDNSTNTPVPAPEQPQTQPQDNWASQPQETPSQPAPTPSAPEPTPEPEPPVWTDEDWAKWEQENNVSVGQTGNSNPPGIGGDWGGFE